MNVDDNDDRLEVYCDFQIMMALDGDSQKFFLISQIYYEPCHILIGIFQNMLTVESSDQSAV